MGYIAALLKLIAAIVFKLFVFVYPNYVFGLRLQYYKAERVPKNNNTIIQ
jgi:hypothetical protein